MQWIGWLAAIVALGAAVWLWRKLVAERAHTAQLLYARIDAENQADTLRANQARVLRTGRLAAIGGLLTDTSQHLHAPLQALQTDIETAARQFADYRELVKRYDAAVQYCLQPVELIFGADKASLDQLVHHVEGARRKLFEARTALEKNAVHAGNRLLKDAADELRPLDGFSRGLLGLSATADAASGVDVNASLDEVLELLAPRLGDRITIVRDYQSVPSLRDAGGRLHEIFLHVLDNAARAIAGSGRITLATRSGKDGNSVDVAISDSGDGIADEALPHLFDAFFTTRLDEASGLGLTLVQEWVSARGGSIAVRSTRGHGATFTLSLPVRPEAPRAVENEPAPSHAAALPGWAATAH
jgi:signal transduction histidine kinase